MTAPYDPGDREKVSTKLPLAMRKALKVRAAQLNVDIQSAVTDGATAWLALDHPLPAIDTSGGTPFATYLPTGLLPGLRERSAELGLAFNQCIGQSIQLWLSDHEVVGAQPRSGTRRIVVCNQKGGVGKTTVSAGVAQAFAERGLSVLLVDFDPQGHLTRQFGFDHLKTASPSLAKYMLGDDINGQVQDLFITVEEETYGKRLQLLPACADAFLLDARLATNRVVRIKETALERALEGIESMFDVIVIDCPPSLGYAMDNALYYARTRTGEDPGQSGLVIPVQAEDSSLTAFEMLQEQIDDLSKQVNAQIHCLGLVVNLYDARKGYVATSSLSGWEGPQFPRVLGIVRDRKDQREAVRMCTPLLVHAPVGEQAAVMRKIVRELG